MADDEQFSLCWNNFNSNLSAGFHESLIRGDLVDVTLAAEGQFVKAHRLVLSVCSPYFRKMFTQMPANQHAFVFLKDVSHTALKDLIQFMYCGEVNVKQEALPAFISTAEALQIKGLTDSEPAQQTPAEPATVPITQIHNVNAPQRQRQRSTTTRTYKLETVDDTDDDQPAHHHQTSPSKIQATQIVIQTTAPSSTSTQQHLQQVVQQSNVQQITSASATTSGTSTQKRPLRASGGPTLKRTKNTSTTSTSLVDPLETATETITSQPQITVQAAIVNTMATSKQADTSTTETAEYIDLPLELPSTKSEPDYADDTGDNDNDQDGAYVEDDTYGEMRYDESYFTEGEEGNAGSATGNTTSAVAKTELNKSGSFTDTFTGGESGDQANNDTQGDEVFVKPVRKRGRPKIREEVPQEKLMDKLAAACARHAGNPTVYASTTKGAMKIIYEGHHFRYSFRKGQYSIFQCCYKENKEECRVRVVSDQKRIYPLDGEHIHFVQATDKSVTSMSFEPGEASELETNVKIEPEPINDEPRNAEYDDKSLEENIDNNDTNQVKTELNTSNTENQDSPAETIDANDFREKIKRRLQKALLGKKK